MAINSLEKKGFIHQTLSNNEESRGRNSRQESGDGMEAEAAEEHCLLTCCLLSHTIQGWRQLPVTWTQPHQALIMRMPYRPVW